MPSSNSSVRLCRVCFAEHDDEIHGATLRVRAWFHKQVMQGFHAYGQAEEPIVAAPVQAPAPAPTVEAIAVA